MLCAGLTVWSPLVRAGVGKGQQVGVVGLGGLGHFAVMWANGLGAEVTVISHSPHKKADALELGAKHFVISNEKGWAKPLAFKFDFLLNTSDAANKFVLAEYLSTLKVGRQFHQVGFPDKPIPDLNPMVFMANNSSIGASHLGNRLECLDMLRFAAENKLFPAVETLPIGEKGCAEALERVKRNDVRYRFTLMDYDKALGS